MTSILTSPIEVRERTSADEITLVRRIQRWIYHQLMRGVMLSHNLAVILAEIIGSMGRGTHVQASGDGWQILLTGTFHADNWVKAHLYPLAMSQGCSKVWVVSATAIPDLPNVSAIYPPGWMMRLFGRTPARMLVFIWTAIRFRPDVVGGFALFVNGLVSAVVAPLVGARSLYFCVGGPIEVLDGGVWTECGPLAAMETPDAVVEHCLIRAVNSMDHIVTMGTRATEFFRAKGVTRGIHVISGGIGSDEFRPAEDPPPFDMILAARLTEIKRIDNFLRIVKHVSVRMPAVRAVIVGDGHLRGYLEQLACELGIGRNVFFAGHQQNMGDWLRRARIFVLTSESEGLSLALMEAMMCGLPAVVSDVGDLGDLVADGVNGFLVDRNLPGLFAERILGLLLDEPKCTQFAHAARKSALQYETGRIIREWEFIFPPALAEKGAIADGR